MTIDNKNDLKKRKWIRWIARIWSIPIIVYSLLTFFGYGWNWIITGVADPYVVEGISFLEVLPVLFLFLGVLCLIIAWKWERLGATISLVFLIITVTILLIQGSGGRDLIAALAPYLLTIVVAIPGILFLVSSYQHNKLR